MTAEEVKLLLESKEPRKVHDAKYQWWRQGPAYAGKPEWALPAAVFALLPGVLDFGPSADYPSREEARKALEEAVRVLGGQP